MYSEERILNLRWADAIRVLRQTTAYAESFWKTGKMMIERDLDTDNPSVKITILEPRYHTLDQVPREIDTG